MSAVAVVSSIRTTSVVATGALVALTLAACGTPEVTPLSSDAVRLQVEPAQASALPDLVAAADTLALDLLAAAGDVTTVTSPASLQVVLSMAAEGAEGETLAQLESLVGAEGPERSDGMNALVATLADLDGDPSVVSARQLPDAPVVHRAGRLVLDESLTVKQPFVDALARSYDAPAQTTDLTSDGASKVLDAWVDEHTGGLVPESAIVPGPELRLVLQDAIVLAARWESPFLPEATKPAPFTLPSGEQVEVDMMSNGAMQDVAYAQVEGWQAVRLPYAGGRLAADVVLPPEGTSPADLSPADLQELTSGLDAADLAPLLLRRPTVEARSTVDLMPFLEERAPAALVGGFGGITDEPLMIAQAMQQGVLLIDEDGTRAAAVTEFGAAGGVPAERPTELTIDRPYLIRIADGETGWPLFVAHVADPRG